MTPPQSTHAPSGFKSFLEYWLDEKTHEMSGGFNGKGFCGDSRVERFWYAASPFSKGKKTKKDRIIAAWKKLYGEIKSERSSKIPAIRAELEAALEHISIADSRTPPLAVKDEITEMIRQIDNYCQWSKSSNEPDKPLIIPGGIHRYAHFEDFLRHLANDRCINSDAQIPLQDVWERLYAMKNDDKALRHVVLGPMRELYYTAADNGSGIFPPLEKAATALARWMEASCGPPSPVARTVYSAAMRFMAIEMRAFLQKKNAQHEQTIQTDSSSSLELDSFRVFWLARGYQSAIRSFPLIQAIMNDSQLAISFPITGGSLHDKTSITVPLTNPARI